MVGMERILTPMLKSTMKHGPSIAALLAVLAGVLGNGIAAAQSETLALYACAESTTADVTLVGVTICDAQPTADLARRATLDNLQIREGAIIVQLDPKGVSTTSGLQAGDMIYRVGGIDIPNAETAVEHLARVGRAADTVVNFLRGGRPYRVKLRIY
jgi:S1-C subfamily serine protease